MSPQSTQAIVDYSLWNCDKCNKYDTLKFIEDSKKKYGNLYEYDKTVYINHVTPIILFCNAHAGYFKITPQIHLRGGVCPDCNDGFTTANHITKEQCQEEINNSKYKHTVIKLERSNRKINLTLKCDNKNHKEFTIRYHQTKLNHVCAECEYETIVNTFLENANKKYGNLYDYSNMKYINNSTKIQIRCTKHNETFYQTPSKHLDGVGCPQCIKLKRMAGKLLTKEQFIEKATIIHSDKYLYDEVVYKKSSIPVKIFCKTHNEFFWQTPNAHLSGHGCRKCGTQRTINYRRVTMDEFIERSNNIHDNKYDYSKVVQWDDEKDKVVIICPVHGDFTQSWYGHLKGCGCSKCSKINFSKGEKKIYNYLKSKNISFKQQVKMNGCKYKHHLLFDFCIEINSKIALIEFNGAQHYKETPHFNKRYNNSEEQFKSQQERDATKVSYCLKQNIPFLVIKYTDIDCVDKILEKFINTINEEHRNGL